ncbi:peptidoglycan-binding domain-containing protein [Actinoplanes sp. NPDC026623]|uniref:peptidoglycan-binding domain-containing protein n=1 Tax=Actinoplanes sp. NPDC026623 TaxID=3155610 RepID=UPI0033FB58C4
MNEYSAAAMATRLLGALDDPARAAVRRCSVVTSFDEPLYNEILRDGGPGLDELVDEGCIEANRGWGGFQVPRTLRDAAWTSWWSEAGLAPASRRVPPSLRDLAIRVAERPATPPEEELRALVLADPDRAAGLFERVYRERDEVLDYPGCQDLLDVLARPELLPLLGARLVELRNDRDRYLKARLFWHPSMVATARYLPRPPVEARLNALVASHTGQALRMYATGGMGKSTVAHRFIAWECVARRIPCALVDLDTEVFDATVAVRWPWLVILEFAAQLNLQIDGAPYQELLREYGVYRSMLLPATGDAARSSSAATADLAALQRYASEVVERFRRVTAALPIPVLLVLDTLEEATLCFPEADALIGMLAELCETAAPAKLVLAGRGTASEAEMPSLRRLFPDAESSDLAIEPFTRDEAVRYLREVRGVDDEALVDVVADRAAGSPWLLSMYADVAAYRTADPAVVAGYDPYLAWCIDRVVARLGGALQWMVRYGVVPRQLDRDFAERIVHPRMVAGLTGAAPDDDPALDRRPPHVKALFPADGTPGPPFAAVWDSLARYANESSWARLSADRRTVRFDDALSGPMRRMLADQPVSRHLHADAVRYYRAAGDRLQELYHLFQLDPEQWAVRWRQAIEDCWSRGDIDGVIALTADAAEPGYVGEPDPFGMRSGPAVDDPSLAHAYTEQAWALAVVGRRDGIVAGDPLWARVLRCARNASALDTGHRPARWLAAHATCLLMSGQYAEALEALERGPDPGADHGVGTELALLRAEALVGLGRHGDAWPSVVPAVQALEPAREFPWTVVRAANLAAVLACRQGKIDWACDLVDGVLDNADARARGGLRRLRARLALNAGAPGHALTLLDRDTDADLLVEALLDLGRPEDGVDSARSALSMLDADGQAARRAQLLTLAARCHAALLDHPATIDLLDQAFAIWSSLQDIGAAALTALTKAGLILDTAGDLRTAQAYLEEFERLQPHPTGVHQARHAILSARLAAARGNRTAAYATCVRALDALAAQDEDVRLRAEVAVLALTVASPEDADAVAGTLEALLDRIEPRAARTRLLAGLSRGTGPIGAAWRWTGDGPTAEAEPVVLRWTAEVCLAAGNVEDAVRLAALAAGDAADDYGHWSYVEFLSRAHRLDLAPPPQPPPDTWPHLRDAYFVLRYEDAEPGDEALDRLDIDGTTQWAARAQVARSRMLRRLGRDAEAAAYRAREIYSDLDDPREDDPELVVNAADARGVLPGWGYVIDARISVGGDGDLRIDDEPLTGALRRLAEVPDAVIRIEADPAAAPEPFEITVPWPAAARAVYRAPRTSTQDKAEARLIQFALTVLGRSPGKIDGRFGTRTRRELIAFQSARVRPADGEAGPRTWAALTRAVRELPARPPVVLSLERDVEDSINSARGVTHYGAPLAFLFESLEWVHGSLELLGPQIPAVDLLYVNGSMESSGQVPVISARSETYGYESPWRAASQVESLTVTMFDRFLRQAAEVNGLAPVVVLDVSLSASKSEADRQVRLRNDFAHQLMSMGHAPTILGTGSGPDASPENLVSVLDAAARFGWTAVDLLVRAREQQAYEAGVALFSAAPIERFPVIATTRRR